MTAAVHGSTAPLTIPAIFEPMLRELREAGREIGDAARDYVRTERGSARELQREVGDAWHDQPTIERRVVVAGYEALENLVQAHVRRTGAAANVVREVAEGAGEVLVNGPAITATRLAAEHAARGVGEAARWVSGRAARGADGAVRAAGVVAETHRATVQRSIDQHRENASEVVDAARRVASTARDNQRELRDEVAAAWRDQPTIERRVAVAGYEVVENAIQGAIRSHQARVEVVRELGEAAAENAATSVRNLGETISGGMRAAGELLGGLFG